MIPACASRLGVSEPALRAVLLVECGTDDPDRWLGLDGRAIVRVEAHHVLRRVAAGDHGLRVGRWQGGPGEPLEPWKGHEVRVDGAWWSYHGRQERAANGQPGEYDALDVAAGLLGDEGACECSSWGPGQVLGRYATTMGLPSALAMRDLAATPEGGLELVERYLVHVNPAALRALRAMDWRGFAGLWNGPGKASEYAEQLRAAYQRAA